MLWILYYLPYLLVAAVLLVLALFLSVFLWLRYRSANLDAEAERNNRDLQSKRATQKGRTGDRASPRRTDEAE